MSGPSDESRPLGGPARMYAADAEHAAGDARQAAVDAGGNARTAKLHAERAEAFEFKCRDLMTEAIDQARRARLAAGLSLVVAAIAVVANILGSFR